MIVEGFTKASLLILLLEEGNKYRRWQNANNVKTARLRSKKKHHDKQQIANIGGDRSFPLSTLHQNTGVRSQENFFP
ncbi:hypothetical protein [Nostoc sp. KVJ20]|uniref:hypothetical protein n=1 Tax=Nostoc sp. KVJ20 TaxID=457944 RepID=UPI00114CE763|nr:hypothetical protein [Nostoc sp. KVJ20]